MSFRQKETHHGCVMGAFAASVLCEGLLISSPKTLSRNRHADHRAILYQQRKVAA